MQLFAAEYSSRSLYFHHKLTHASRILFCDIFWLNCGAKQIRNVIKITHLQLLALFWVENQYIYPGLIHWPRNEQIGLTAPREIKVRLRVIIFELHMCVVQCAIYPAGLWGHQARWWMGNRTWRMVLLLIHGSILSEEIFLIKKLSEKIYCSLESIDWYPSIYKTRCLGTPGSTTT